MKHDAKWFEQNRPEIVNTVRQIERERFTLLVAPVKSGKRELVECCSVRNNPDSGYNAKHFYLSALNRIDDKPQLAELEEYDIGIYLSGRGQDLLKEIASLDDEYDHFYIHINESDYGTGSKQLLNGIFPFLRNNPKVQIIAYSATQDEAIQSTFAKFCKIVHFQPPTIYCGTKWYLDNNRVKEAEPFWDQSTGQLMPQGVECCERLKLGNHIFGVIRIPYKMQEVKGGIFAQVIKDIYGFEVTFIDAKNPYNWGDGSKADWAAAEKFKIKTILVICQTATRSTELKFHKHISFWHGSERKKTAHNTIIQADCRPIYYNTPEIGPVDIIIYSSIEDFKLNAGIITSAEYTKKLSQRMKSSVSSTGIVTTQKLVVVDKLPTLAGFNKIAKQHSAKCDYVSETKHRVSANIGEDIAGMALRQHLSGTSRNGQRFANTVLFDAPNLKYLSSWADIQQKGYDGKFGLILEFDQTVAVGATHLTTNKSMYSI